MTNYPNGQAFINNVSVGTCTGFGASDWNDTMMHQAPKDKSELRHPKSWFWLDGTLLDELPTVEEINASLQQFQGISGVYSTFVASSTFPLASAYSGGTLTATDTVTFSTTMTIA